MYITANTIRRILLKDIYKPHDIDELRGLGVTVDSLYRELDPERVYGVWWYGTKEVRKTYVTKHSRRAKDVPESDWIAVPIDITSNGQPAIPLEHIEATRRYFETKRGWSDREGTVPFELQGLMHCEACGRRMTRFYNNKHRYYVCVQRRNYGRDSCPDSQNVKANRIEDKVMWKVQNLLSDPERLASEIDKAMRGKVTHDPAPALLEAIQECETKRDAFQEQQAIRLMTLNKLAEKLRGLDKIESQARERLNESLDRSKRAHELQETKREVLQAYSQGILYDGLHSFTPEMRRESYDALNLKIVAGGSLEKPLIELDPNARAIRLARGAQEWGEEAVEYKGKLNSGGRPKTAVFGPRPWSSSGPRDGRGRPGRGGCGGAGRGRGARGGRGSGRPSRP